MQSKVLLLAIIVFAFMVTACAPKDFPAGDYGRAEPSSTNEAVTVKFAQDGTYSIVFYNQQQMAGTYARSGDKITLNESEGGPCFGSPLTMQWSAAGSDLTLKLVEDACTLGLGHDLGGTWTAQAQ